MRAVVQRVSRAEVTVDGRVVGAIDHGLLVLLGAHRDDTPGDVRWLADKLVHLRIFEDDEELMNLDLAETGGAMLVVSQFTLLGDCRRGRRPSWSTAARPEQARELYEELVARMRKTGIRVETGQFQAMMEVSLVNNGPVTILLDSHKQF